MIWAGIAVHVAARIIALAGPMRSSCRRWCATLPGQDPFRGAGKQKLRVSKAVRPLRGWRTDKRASGSIGALT